MATSGVFAPRGNTIRFLAFAGPGMAHRAPTETGGTAGYDFTLTNLGPGLAVIGVGASESEAISRAVIPAVGDPTGVKCFILPPGQRSIEAHPLAYFAAVTFGGTADILITPGKGPVDGFTGDLLAATSGPTDISDQIRELRDQLRDLLVELKAQTYILREGFVINDEVETIRHDIHQATTP